MCKTMYARPTFCSIRPVLAGIGVCKKEVVPISARVPLLVPTELLDNAGYVSSADAALTVDAVHHQCGGSAHRSLICIILYITDGPFPGTLSAACWGIRRKIPMSADDRAELEAAASAAATSCSASDSGRE
jgi:hypothetical protein